MRHLEETLEEVGLLGCFLQRIAQPGLLRHTPEIEPLSVIEDEGLERTAVDIVLNTPPRQEIPLLSVSQPYGAASVSFLPSPEAAAEEKSRADVADRPFYLAN